MELFASQDPRSYSLYFDLNIWFRARKVTGTFEKRAPGLFSLRTAPHYLDAWNRLILVLCKLNIFSKPWTWRKHTYLFSLRFLQLSKTLECYFACKARLYTEAMLFPYHKSKVAIKLAKSWEFELEAFISMHEEGFSCVSHHLIMA